MTKLLADDRALHSATLPGKQSVAGAYARFEAVIACRWASIGILLAAAVLRLWHASDWSLWLDEATTIYMSQHPENLFARSFPLFFLSLQAVYEVTGISVTAGRLLAGTMGVLSIGLALVFLRELAGQGSRLAGQGVGLLAALFLAFSFGHLFWSQAIRYYILVFLLESLSTYSFIRGFERNERRQLFLSNVALLLALLTHSTAALLMPVFVGYLILAFFWRKNLPAGYSRGNVLFFAVALSLVLLLGVWRFSEIRISMSAEITGAVGASQISASRFFFMAMKMGAYFGVPLVGLAVLAPFVVRTQLLSRRLLCFFLLLSFLPILELVVIAALNLAYVDWYYAFFAMFGMAALSALTIVAVYQHGWRLSGTLLLGAVLSYQLFFVYDYFTTMHGNRPRWQEAVAWLRQKAGADFGKPGQPRLLSTSDVVVGFYLGAPLDRLFQPGVVDMLPRRPPDVVPAQEHWYLVEPADAFPEYARWLVEHCVVEHRFEARTGTRDRTIVAYHFRPRSHLTSDKGAAQTP